jgi:heptosyltransferase II
MGKSLVIMPNWIGDIALALSVITRKTAFGQTDLTLLVPAHLVELCTLFCPFPCIPYNRTSRKDFVETIEFLRAAQFDSAYILPVSFSSAWCAMRAGVRRRRGVSRESRGIILTEALSATVRDFNHHLTREYAEVLETPYFPPETWQAPALAHLRKKSDHTNAVVFCPGAKYGPAKRWPWYGELAKRMPEERIVLLGDDDEAETGKAIAASAPNHFINLIGKTTLQEAVSIVAQARLVVSNDSGLMHLAGFLGTPVVAIFGSTSPMWTRPLGDKARIAKVDCECSPCFSRTCRYSHYDCLKKVTPDQVESLAKQLLLEC